MFRSIAKFATILIGIILLGALLAGCGGGHANTASITGVAPNGQAEQSFQFGELSGRAAISNPPLVSNGSGATVTALKGDISSLLLNDPSPTFAEIRIIFSSERDGNREIYAMNIDGTNQTRLTNNPAWDGEPTVSPDGALIAFVSNRTGHDNIWVMGSNGSPTVQLTNGTAEDHWPVYSPDGSKIAFYSNRSGTNQIYVMTRNGTNVTRLTNNNFNDTTPAWSPDGNKIAFVSDRDGNTEIYVMSSTGTSQTRLTNDPANDLQPAWTTDGTRIAFVTGPIGNYNIYFMNADGTNVVRGTNNKFNDITPAFAPDNLHSAYASDRDGNWEIYLSGFGLTPVRMTNNLYVDTKPVFTPFVRQRTLLGAGGILGQSAGGFLFGQQGDKVSSIVSFDAQTRTSVLITNQTGLNNNGPNLIYSLDADSLTSLAFVQNPAYLRTAIIGSGSNLASASGALISFNAATGGVAAVLPFTGSRAAGIGSPAITTAGGQRILRGQFLGVWDGKGNNLAPNGAKEVSIDLKTSAVVSVK